MVYSGTRVRDGLAVRTFFFFLIDSLLIYMSSGKDERYAIALILRIKAAETSVGSALTVYRCRMFQSSVLIKHSDRVFRSNVLSIDAVVLIKRSNPTLVSDVCILRILDTFHRLFIAALINH